MSCTLQDDNKIKVYKGDTGRVSFKIEPYECEYLDMNNRTYVVNNGTTDINTTVSGNVVTAILPTDTVGEKIYTLKETTAGDRVTIFKFILQVV